MIVLDNASSDGSVAMLRGEFPEVKVIANSENVGFAQGVNKIVAQATGDYVLLLNPDTWIAKGALARLVETVESDRKIAVAGAQLTSFSGDSQQSVLAPPSLTKEFLNLLPEVKSLVLPNSLRRRLLRRRESYQGKYSTVPAVSGGAMLIRSVVFREVGGMDPRFFVYHEEVDLCQRIQKAGWKIVFVPDAQILHSDALSTGYRTNRLPSEPVLSWRLSGLSILFEKHGSRAEHRAFLRMANILLRSRACGARLRALFSRNRSTAFRARANELTAAADQLVRAEATAS